MNQEITIYTAARLQALEYLVAHLYTINYVSSGYTLEQVKAVNDAMIEKISTHSIQNTSAAMSDHYVDEMTTALKDILGRVLGTLTEAQRRLSP